MMTGDHRESLRQRDLRLARLDRSDAEDDPLVGREADLPSSRGGSRLVRAISIGAGSTP